MHALDALDALGNPTRRHLLELLRDAPREVAALHAELSDISRPAVSKHLRVLKDAGLVDARPDGTRNVYSVRPEGFDDVRSYLERFWDDALPRFVMVAENPS